GTPPDMEFIVNQIALFTNPTMQAVNYHFCLRMSRTSARQFIWRAIRNVLYTVTGALLVSQLVFFVASLRGQEALISLAYRHFWITELKVVYMRSFKEVIPALALGASCAVLIWGYRHSQSADYRRRVRWFAAGCAVGMAPVVLLNSTGFLFSIAGHGEWLI